MNNEDKIRNRVSYKEFKNIADAIKNEDLDTALWKIYKLLDNKGAFYSRTLALYASESLSLLIKDEIKP